MKFFSNITKRLMLKEPKKILGRWNIETCKKRVDKKVDLSNEDHCGPCGTGAVVASAVPAVPLPNSVVNAITVKKKYPLARYR
jgi:hypothetical protein